MKEFVKEQLAQRDLIYLFNETDYKYYLNKTRKNGTGGNKTLIALSIFDMFILNGVKKAA